MWWSHAICTTSAPVCNADLNSVGSTVENTVGHTAQEKRAVTHMVIFRSPEGKPGYHQTDDLEAAIRFVEHLRNEEGVSDARIFVMQEVPIEFRTYYKVEVAGRPGPLPTSAAVSSGEETGVEAPVEPPAPEPVATGGRFGLFSRS